MAGDDEEGPAFVAELYIARRACSSGPSPSTRRPSTTGAYLALAAYHARSNMAELDEAKKLLDEAIEKTQGKVLLVPFYLRNALRLREGRRDPLPEHAEQGARRRRIPIRTCASRTPSRSAPRGAGSASTEQRISAESTSEARRRTDSAPRPRPPPRRPPPPPRNPRRRSRKAREAGQAGEACGASQADGHGANPRIRAARSSQARRSRPNLSNSDATDPSKGQASPREVRRMFRKFVMMFAAAAFVTGTSRVAGATTTLKIGTRRPARLVLGQGVQEAHQGRVGRHERRAAARLPVERAGG